MFDGIFSDRRVLVTGHTGFKGAWLCRWLERLGASVTGLALAPNTDPALFDLLGLGDRIQDHRIDVRDSTSVDELIEAVQPEVVLHLAAQPLVRLSYQDPKATWDVNVGGTVNLLESVRRCESVKACVVVTSDKCYENREWPWGYRECDALGGHDPYSASKGATEVAVASWRRSFFPGDGCRLASARAGNVIGGGDWAGDRIVTDFVSSIRRGAALHLRNPAAVRPWQHVLEPLSGYLHLACKLLGDDGADFADAWNFGPNDASVITVQALAEKLVHTWGRGSVEIDRGTHPHEAGLLKLDCSKARTRLQWYSVWDVDRTIQETVRWYRGHADGADPLLLTDQQIESFELDAASAQLEWAERKMA